MNKDIQYWVATSAIPGVGTATFNFLLHRFKTLKHFWDADSAEIKKLKLDAKTKESILEFRANVDPKIYLEAVYKKGIKVLSLVDRDYPANLRQISDAPPVLYFRGTLLPADDLAVAVVSGLARGIDSIAHRAALSAGGRTIAVLGSGVDTIYPPENWELAGKIIQNGAIVSEFPLGFPSVPSNFPARNRIISGLSLGVLVTEAALDSGSMITAGQAAEQGREVFAVPGPIVGKMSEGTNNLIKEGVHPATEAADILEILNIEQKSRQVTRNTRHERIIKDKDQAKILSVLDGAAKHIDAIVREVDLPIEKVSSTLSLMELSGFVKNYGSGMWGE